MKISELLPVGSVVSIKDNGKSLLIIGIMQKQLSTGKIYDYIGVFYPEGYIGGKMQFLFMHDDIKKIHYTGFKNKDYFRLLEKIESMENEKNQ